MQTQIHGGDIYSRTYQYDFSTNINPFGMPEKVKLAAMKGIENSVHYPDVQCRKLREAIAKKEQIPKEWILCGNGAAELIFSIAAAKNPKKALLISPGFAEYEQALGTIPCEIVFHELSREQGFLLGEDYLECLEEDIDLIFLCNPNNPTGLLIEPSLLDRILEKCRKKDIFVVLDECFLEFVSDEMQNPQKKRLKENPSLFILKAFTKMYGMPGLRLGYGLCSDTVLLQKMKERTQPWNVSIPAQLAGAAACEEVGFVTKTRESIEKERSYLSEELQKLGFRVYPSAANYLFFEGPKELYEVCEEEGVLLRDCSNYRSLSQGDYRIAVRQHKENEALIRILKKHYEGETCHG